MSTPCFGRVVWATILDSQGRNPKRRPLIILTPTESITADATVFVVGVSTKFDRDAPEAQTELPFDPRGASRSGLRERCWAVSTWVVEVAVSAIESYAGTIPGLVMAEIIRKIPPTQEG